MVRPKHSIRPANNLQTDSPLNFAALALHGDFGLHLHQFHETADAAVFIEVGLFGGCERGQARFFGQGIERPAVSVRKLQIQEEPGNLGGHLRPRTVNRPGQNLDLIDG